VANDKEAGKENGAAYGNSVSDDIWRQSRNIKSDKEEGKCEGGDLNTGRSKKHLK